ncbi:MAG: CDP-alcohol phosphatidyltransferase family protein [Clostridiales bacterium]|nr:CDP-alcohol phosphatidyltransferase family protein [Clostridiales bacterium]
MLTVREYIKKNLNLPNVLTLIRLCLVPVYVAFFVRGMKYAALITFLAASFTDLLDGRIARHFNLITDFGKLMDPFADKVMVLTAMASMAIGNAAIPPVIPWAAVIILLGKELVMVIGGVVMLKHGIVVYSSMIGKVAHCVFIGSLIASYFHEWFLGACPGWPLTPDLILLWLAVCLTLCALVFYVNQSIKTAKEKGIL